MSNSRDKEEKLVKKMREEVAKIMNEDIDKEGIWVTTPDYENMANAMSKLKCIHCGKTNEWSIGMHMHGNRERLFLECKCGTHTHMYLFPSCSPEVHDWWR